MGNGDDSQMDGTTVRLRHYQGERLLAGDLQQDYDSLEWLRGLHVAALHDTWGIALGFDARTGPGSELLVGPGFAYDCLGHEIVLAREVSVPVDLLGQPAGSYTVDLVMSYDPQVGQQGRPEPQLCEGRVGKEHPTFRWRLPGETRLGLELPLGRLAGNGTDPTVLDGSVRRYTQPLARPHIVAGITPGGQRLSLWTMSGLEDRRVLGYRMRVDTSQAGFVGAPYYSAWLTSGANIIEAAAQAPIDPSLQILTSISDPAPDHFTFNILLMYLEGPTEELLLHDALVYGSGIFSGMRADAEEEARREGRPVMQQRRKPSVEMRVSWVGIEPVMGCAPQPQWRALIAHLLLLDTRPQAFRVLALGPKLFGNHTF